MKVTTLETYFLSAPLPQAVRTSTHRIASMSEVIVKLTTDAGLVGIGEAHGPFLFQPGPEGLRSVSDILRAITPLVVGQDPFDVERIWQDLFALTYTSVRGIPPLARQQRPLVTAMSAIDIALWDLKGKAIGRPVWALLGGARGRLVRGARHFLAGRPHALVRRAAHPRATEGRGRYSHRGRRDGSEPLRPAHAAGGRAGGLSDHRLDLGGGTDDVAEGGRHGRAVSSAHGRASRSPDPCACGGRQSDRVHPGILRGPDP